MRFIKNLSEDDLSALKTGFKTGSNSRFRMRCQAIMLSYQGTKINDLASLYDVGRDTIRSWFDRWEDSGISGLHDDPKPGRPPKLDTNNADHVSRVKELVAKESQKLDQVCLSLEEEFEIRLSRKSLKRFLKSLVTDGSVLEHHLNSGKIPSNTKRDSTA